MARYYGNNGYYSYYADYLSLPPLHLCFFVGVLFLVLGFSWYINYESVVEDMMSQLKLFLMLCPVVLLLLVHFLSNEADRNRVPFFLAMPEQDSLHRAGGSPWGVAAVLVFLIFMVSYQSSLQERWFPLLSK
ncbi:uncharacterized protein LOC104422297 [Eucalyptus grandis]|uniref:Uncharacterized protein n=3 Tax=Eucalyptus TaxID=3932 RepID=A0ACC3J877_EUCGR|nr:uncharacterized protein LOC104422297 [Eucalyptus grandis]KAK3409690.1 hypothetical protein EUGRSUZ_J01788 [Eucalyptus grandis]